MTAPPDYDPSAYPPFAVTVDVALFARVAGELRVLLVVRGQEPWKGHWALPGGFVDVDEDLPDAALRELEEETGIRGPDLAQLGAYGAPDRDPRMRIVSVAYWATVADPAEPTAGDDADDALWVSVSEALSDPSRFASDHHRILADAVKRMTEPA